MIGMLASLRDWVRDQVHEIQHLTVVAVLAPAKCKPVGHVADDDLPFTQSVPVCEWHCEHVAVAATVRMRTHAIRNDDPTETCRWFTSLVCDCLNAWRGWWESELSVGPVRCGACGRTFRQLSEAIPMVRPL